MKECYNTGFSLKTFGLIKCRAQRKRFQGITKILKLITIRFVFRTWFDKGVKTLKELLNPNLQWATKVLRHLVVKFDF